MPEPRHGAPAPPDRRAWLRDFFRPNRGQLVAGICLFATALLITWTLRSQEAQPEFAQARQADLIQLLDNVTGQNRALESELRELQSVRDELSSGADQAEVARTEADRRLEQLQVLAGVVPARGPGVRITMDAPDGAITSELLLNAIEELRDAGAEVLELNDEVRVVMRTAVTSDDEGHVVVDGTVLDTPIVIDAIGDPVTLEAGARFRGGLVSEVEGQRVGGTVTITAPDEVRIDALAEAREPEFARPR